MAASHAMSHAASPSGMLASMTGGGACVLALLLLRAAFVWFPFHPIGFLIAGTYPMYHLWLSLFVGWMAKVMIVRYGGMRGYKTVLPFFLGLVVGDCANALCWAVLGFFTHNGYPILPG
jgi:hypothetical protein